MSGSTLPAPRGPHISVSFPAGEKSVCIEMLDGSAAAHLKVAAAGVVQERPVGVALSLLESPPALRNEPNASNMNSCC